MTERNSSHGQLREPFLEKYLSHYRYSLTLRFLRAQAKKETVCGLDFGCGYHGLFVGRANRLPGVRFVGCDLFVDPMNPDLSVCPDALPGAMTIRSNVITLHSVLEHLSSPEAVLKQLSTMLVPGGHLVMNFPSPRARRVLEFLAFKLHVISENEIRDHKRYWDKELFEDFIRRSEMPLKIIVHRYFQLGMNNWVLLRKNIE